MKGRHFCAATGIIKNATEESFPRRIQGMFPVPLHWCQKFIFEEGDNFEENVAEMTVLLFVSRKKKVSPGIFRSYYVDLRLYI
jgi:hypothetical protein